MNAPALLLAAALAAAPAPAAPQAWAEAPPALHANLGPDPGIAAFLTATAPLGAAALGVALQVRGANPDPIAGAVGGYLLGTLLQGAGHAYAGDPARGFMLGLGGYGAGFGGAFGGLLLSLVTLPGTPTSELLSRPLMGMAIGATLATGIYHVGATVDAAQTARERRAANARDRAAGYNRAP